MMRRYSQKKKRKTTGGSDTNYENIQSGYRKGIWQWKMCQIFIELKENNHNVTNWIVNSEKKQND